MDLMETNTPPEIWDLWDEGDVDHASCQKIKLLKLMEIFRNETDEAHPMLASEVCERLRQEGIRCDRRTLTRDVQALAKFGYEIMSVLKKHEKAYYVEDRPFTVPELKILIDAVHASSFITPPKAQQLIENLSQLGGIHQAERLTGNMVQFNNRKHSNEQIFYNVDHIERALLLKRKVTFRYFHLDESKNRVYKKDGALYVTEPVALVFCEDNYYLVTYNEKYHSRVTYRVDRMDMVNLLDEYVSERALAMRDDMVGYTGAVFHMYSGQLWDVTLQFKNDVIDAIYDKFGEGQEIYRVDEEHCKAYVKVGISPTFWGWLFQFGSKVKILAPSTLIQMYKEKLQEQLDSLA